MKLNIAKQGIILAFVPMLFQLVFVAILINELHKVEKFFENKSFLREVAREHNALHYDYGEYLIYKYLCERYGGQSIEQKKFSAFEKVDREIAQLKKLSSKEPSLNKRFEKFEKRFKDKKKSFSGERIPPLQFYSDSSAQIESRYQYSRALIQQGFNRVILTGFGISVLLSLLIAVLFSRYISSRLTVLKDNAIRVPLRLPLHPSVTGTDEIALLDRTFHHMVDELQAADSQKKQLLALLSDNLKRPLDKATRHLTEAGESEPNDSMIQKKLNSIRGNILRLCSLIQDLLDVENIDSGNMEMTLSPHKISSILEEAVSALQGYLSSKNLQVAIEKKSDSTITADALKLEQVLINFLSNAIKFSPKNGTIEIIVENSDAESIKINVIDYGPGIPENAHLFQRFSQANPEADTAIGGSGLGLSICKTIIEAHGGEIGAENIPGKGSCFWFRLPLSQQKGVRS